LLSDSKGVKKNIIRVEDNKKNKMVDLIAREKELTIFLNQKKIVKLNCSPGDYKCLGVGFLFTAGILAGKEEIKSIKTEKDSVNINTKVDTLISGKMNQISSTIEVSRQYPKMTLTDSNFFDNYKINPGTVYHLIAEMQEKASFFKLSGGVHSCALADADGTIVLFSEDISRYNTIDRVLGEALLKDIDTNDKIMLTSCRITLGIIKKIMNADIPIVISRAAVTDSAVRMANLYCITLIGFTRGKRMNIYTHPERITF